MGIARQSKQRAQSAFPAGTHLASTNVGRLFQDIAGAMTIDQLIAAGQWTNDHLAGGNTGRCVGDVHAASRPDRFGAARHHRQRTFSAGLESMTVGWPFQGVGAALTDYYLIAAGQMDRKMLSAYAHVTGCRLDSRIWCSGVDN